MHDFVLYVNR